ncbi:MAG: AraC family transcriptional regulator, partial [Chryseobacterium sp.]
MNNNKVLLNTPELKKENQLLHLVENQTKFNLNNCE